MVRKIKIGDKVRCKITGFTGIVVAKVEFINGCTQFSVLPQKLDKDGNYPEGVDIDQESLEIVKRPRKKIVEKSDTGGATRKSKSMKGY